MEDIRERVNNLLETFYGEMGAMSAWIGHMYASEYLSELRERAISLLIEIQNETFMKPLFIEELEIPNVLENNKKDYSGMIDAVYSSDIPPNKSVEIIEMIDAVFINELENLMYILYVIINPEEI